MQQISKQAPWNITGEVIHPIMKQREREKTQTWLVCYGSRVLEMIFKCCVI